MSAVRHEKFMFLETLKLLNKRCLNFLCLLFDEIRQEVVGICFYVPVDPRRDLRALSWAKWTLQLVFRSAPSVLLSVGEFFGKASSLSQYANPPTPPNETVRQPRLIVGRPGSLGSESL